MVGLAAAWRWEWQGAGLALLGTAGFLAAVGFDGKVLAFLMAMSFPAVIWIACAWIARGAATHPGTA